MEAAQKSYTNGWVLMNVPKEQTYTELPSASLGDGGEWRLLDQGCQAIMRNT